MEKNILCRNTSVRGGGRLVVTARKEKEGRHSEKERKQDRATDCNKSLERFLYGGSIEGVCLNKNAAG